MEKMSWLDDFEGKIDEAEVGRMVKQLNLDPLDMLAIAAAVVERRRTKDRCQKRKAIAIAPTDHGESDDDDDDDDYEAAMLKHERRLEREKASVSNLSWCPRQKLKTHVDGIMFSDAIAKGKRWKREKAPKKTIVLDESDPPLMLGQGKHERGSSSATDHGDSDDDDDDGYEAAMLKHERRLERKNSSVSNLSWCPRKKLKTHVDGIMFSDALEKGKRLKREKSLKKTIVLDESDPPLLLGQGKHERGSSSATNCSSFSSKKMHSFSENNECSDSLSKQERLKREKILKNPAITTAPLPKNPKKTMKISYKGPAADLPDGFKTKIAELGGTEIQLVIQKPLYKTDLSRTHSRLSMPFSQIRAMNFLTEEEHAYLNKQSKGNIPEMEVELIDTKLKSGVIVLKRWNLTKDSGKINPMYVLSSNKWNDLVTSNELMLKCNKIVQVWSFRVKSELHLALVLVEETGLFVNGDGNSGSTETEIGSSSNASQSKEETQ